MLKKKVLGLALGLTLAMGSMASATVPDSALTVGGIEYGASEAYVLSVYGTPTEREVKKNPIFAGAVEEIEYGDSFELLLVNGAVRHVEVSRHNGLATADGVEVGMDASVLEAKYGKPDRIHGDEYIYLSESDPEVGLVFEVENGRIDEIESGLLRH